MRAANEARHAKKSRNPAKRICSRCRELKAVEAFGIKNNRTGARRSMWADCFKQYQQNRNPSPQKLEKLGPVLRFILEDGDEHAGVICPDCDQPCRIGDEVVASNAVLRHALHHSE